MATGSRDAIIQKDAVLKGTVMNGGAIEIYGYVEGNIAAERLKVHPGGRFAGQLRVNHADIEGVLQGDAIIRQLITIASTGQVEGSIRYGRIKMDAGGELSAELRNIPPEIAGDLEVVVGRGRSVVVTVMDLMANDPDHGAAALTFTVSGQTGGWVALSDAPRTPVTTFRQTDIEEGRLLFVHDGSEGTRAGFDVVATDGAGATSGDPQSVNVAVLSR